jgi:biopolymer transport protein TolR
MAMSDSGGPGRTQSSINVTPLVDVLLVLLIIFMVVTPILTKALQSRIPKTVEEATPHDYSDRQLVVRLGATGVLRLNADEVSLVTLPERLRKAFTGLGADRTVFVDADDRVPYGNVVQVMDLCRGAGATAIAVLTDSTAAP